MKPGAVIIDVGINFVKDESRPEGFRMVGDVSPCVRSVASIVSPVPGGVGPMTVAMLMRNCVDMALLKDKWAEISDALHPGHTAENARRMQGAVLDMAMDGPEGTGKNKPDPDSKQAKQYSIGEEVRTLLERQSSGITEVSQQDRYHRVERAFIYAAMVGLGSTFSLRSTSVGR